MAPIKFQQIKSRQRGFMLLEIIVALFLVALTLPLLGGVLHMVAQANQQGNQAALTSYEARNVLERILKDTREARRIVEAGADILYLENQSGQLIRYERTGGTVYRTYNTAKIPLSEQVYHLRFAPSGTLLYVEAGDEHRFYRALGGKRL